MRILLAADAVSVHTQRWAAYFRDRGYEVHLASFRPAIIRGISIHLLPNYGLAKLGYLFGIPALKNLYDKLSPDIVHAHYVTSYGFLSALAGMRPLIITAYGSDILDVHRYFGIRKHAARYAFSKANAITVVAGHMKSHVTALGISDDKIKVMPFGADLSVFKMRASGRIGNKPIRIVCTRNFKPIYDVATLIKALGVLKKRGFCFRCSLIGDGPLRNKLKSLTVKLNLAGDVQFLGYTEPGYLAGALDEADIFISPASSDGNNISLNEAMACGCFPVATDIPANSQWLKHMHNGLLFKSGDARELARYIEIAAKDPLFRERARMINRQIAEGQANWLVNAGQMEELYLQYAK